MSQTLIFSRLVPLGGGNSNNIFWLLQYLKLIFKYESRLRMVAYALKSTFIRVPTFECYIRRIVKSACRCSFGKMRLHETIRSAQTYQPIYLNDFFHFVERYKWRLILQLAGKCKLIYCCSVHVLLTWLTIDPLTIAVIWWKLISERPTKTTLFLEIFKLFLYKDVSPESSVVCVTQA